MFTADGETVQPAEVLYKKSILVERGSFRPVTYATNDMLDGAQRKVLAQGKATDDDIVVLMEMTLENLLSEGQLNHADFLARVDILGALGRTVLISTFWRILSARGLSHALHEQDGRSRDGRAEFDGDLRRKILPQPGRRHSRSARAHVQRQPETFGLPDD